jgi:DNA repair protein RAD7
MPSLENVNLRFAGQIKDKVFDYMTQRQLKLRRLQLDSSNLVSDGCWRQFFKTLGPQLEALRLSNLDYSFDDETAEIMSKNCTNLRRLKLTLCWKLTDKAIAAISNLPKLEHLSLEPYETIKPETVTNLIDKLGANLRTLSLKSFHEVNDMSLESIHKNCRRLEKLRLNDNSVCTDKGYASLFTGWSNPPLKFVDVSSTRDVDNANPDGPEEPVGLASDGFIALMKHSGSRLESLDISSCRHVSRSAFESVFSEGQTYPCLKDLDITFHTVVDGFIVSSIFKCCPSIKKLTAFGCSNVSHVKVPAGVALVGGLRAQDSIVVEGDYGMV